MSAGSWTAFADIMREENRCLGELGAAALAMTSILVFGTAAELEAAERRVDTQRRLHVEARSRRTTMMKSGFGELTLRQVCGHAPAPLRSELFGLLREMATRGVALQITVANNKALIVAGLQRIANTIKVLQKNYADQPGTYRRRGTLMPPSGSLIMSRKA